MNEQAYIDRFNARVQRRGSNDCWYFVGTARTWNGYGAMYAKINGKRYWRAHRIAWALAHGEAPPDDRMVLHSCDVRTCCNPAHLFLGDAKSNADDCKAKGRSWFGSRNGRAKLTEADVRYIRACDEPAGDLAKRFKVHATTIAAARNRTKWPHIV